MAQAGLLAEIDPSIFRTYDIRGVVDQSLTEWAVWGIGWAFGQRLKKQGGAKIAVGRDGRLSGQRFQQKLTQGLQAAGIAVLDCGQVTTSMVYFAAETLPDIDGCAVVTGSHNPPAYNGIKLVALGETLYGEAIQSLYQTLKTQSLASLQQAYQTDQARAHGATPSRVETRDLGSDYMQAVTESVALARPLKVVLDAGNGVAGSVAPDIFRALGCEVVPLYCEVDGRFPHHHPDPAKAANLADLIEAVALHQADIGLAFDGDGDRCGVVDDQGEVLYPDRQLMLYARDVLTRQPGAEIIYDIKCSALLAKDIQAHGGRATMWKTGHSYMKAKMKATGAALGGEVSGHMFFQERWYGFDDGIYTGARLCDILSKQPLSAHQLFQTLPDAYNTPEMDMVFEEGAHYAFMEKIKAEAAHCPCLQAATLFTLDGIRADFDHGWGLIRASNTAPLVTLRFEGDTPKALAQVKACFRALIATVAPDHPLPF